MGEKFSKDGRFSVLTEIGDDSVDLITEIQAKHLLLIYNQLMQISETLKELQKRIQELLEILEK